MEVHLEWHRLRGRAATAHAVNLVLRQFAAWCAEQQLDPIRLTREQPENYLVWLSSHARTPTGESLAKTTVEQRIAFLKSFYEWLVERGDIVANPAGKLRMRVTKSRVVVKDYLSLQEATALVQTQAEFVLAAKVGSITWAKRFRVLAAVCLGLATGRRIGGLLAIEVEHLDLERQELRVPKEKGSTGRVLPVAEWAIAVLRAYVRDARPLLDPGGDQPWLFVGGRGVLTRTALMDALQQLVKRTVVENEDLDELPGKNITWHSLRVSFATLLFTNGCPIRSVNELMLHRCLSTTARYTPIPIEDMHQVWRSAHPRP